MKNKQQKRREALARHRVLPFTEWRGQPKHRRANRSWSELDEAYLEYARRAREHAEHLRSLA